MKRKIGNKEYNVLPKIHVNSAAKKNYQYVDDRRKGLIKSIRTKFTRLNSYLMNGLEPNTILCIAAMSGSGKSTIAKCIRNSIWSISDNPETIQYVCNFEMLSHQQVAREIVSSRRIPLRDLYSVDTELSDEAYEILKEDYKNIAKQDVFFIEVSGTADEIVDSLYYYWYTECKPKDLTMVYEIDHVKLCKGKTGQSEKDKLDNLMDGLVNLKKTVEFEGGSTLGIVLSQLNRDIQKTERVMEPTNHRPRTSDIFGASSIEHSCDYIIISHTPARLDITSYTESQLPTVYTQIVNGVEKEVSMIYFELLKNRSGSPYITIPMWNKLDYFDMDEIDIEEFKMYHETFMETGNMVVSNQ